MTDQDALIYVRPGWRWTLRHKRCGFFQLDRRLSMIVDLQLFSQVPLAHVKESSSSTPR